MRSLTTATVIEKIKMEEEFDPKNDIDLLKEDEGLEYDSFDEETEKITKYFKKKKT